VNRFSENALPSLGLGNSAILPSLLVSDPFHQTLNAAIVDFYVHGEGAQLRMQRHAVFSQLWLRCFLFYISPHHMTQVGCSKLKTESGGPTSSQCACHTRYL
jgi:hypothetical protein